jgi:hypothetical protein
VPLGSFKPRRPYSESLDCSVPVSEDKTGKQDTHTLSTKCNRISKIISIQYVIFSFIYV